MSSKEALRYNTGKTQYSYIDMESLKPVADVLAYGAHKYSVFEDKEGKEVQGVDITPNEAKNLKVIRSGRDQWKDGFPFNQLLDSLLRHIVALQNGEYLDPESSLPHIGHIGCNMMFISHGMENHPEHLPDNLKKALMATKGQCETALKLHPRVALGIIV